jgi:hypothetical protein
MVIHPRVADLFLKSQIGVPELMAKSKSAASGADWTRLLADPDLLTHLGELLQTYRDAPPESRDQALLELMRKIKRGAAAASKPSAAAEPEPAAVPAPESAPLESVPPESLPPMPASHPVATAPAATPPFEPDLFTPSWGQDRRRYPRMKCFVVVELRVAGSDKPVWGNLSNTSLGGCLVETPTTFEPGAKIEIGLWVTSGQIWVKGLILNGIVARANPSSGVRVKFAEMETHERESLRQFLKFVENTTKGYATDHGYLAQLKR